MTISISVACCCFGAWNNQALSRNLFGKSRPTNTLQKSFTKEIVDKTEAQMKFDLTYKGFDIVKAVKKILDKEDSKLPAAILWDDEPRSGAKLQRYLSSNRCYCFLRFGVACNGAFILDEMYHQLTSKPCKYLNLDLKVCAICKRPMIFESAFTFH
jgi:hypothetical protein